MATSEAPTRTGEPRKLWIEGPAGRLEAALRVAAPARGAAVLAHPHPLHGGTLHNAVVFHADRELNRAGFTTLRFNFRGVGTSDGVHDQGQGEVEDLSAAASWIRGLAPEVPLVLVGYSFGSWCAIRFAASSPTLAAGIVAIGLPVRIHAFDDALARLGTPLAVVQGELDEFGSPEEVRSLLRRVDSPGKTLVVPGATHLFPRRAAEAAARVLEGARSFLAEPAP